MGIIRIIGYLHKEKGYRLFIYLPVSIAIIQK